MFIYYFIKYELLLETVYGDYLWYVKAPIECQTQSYDYIAPMKSRTGYEFLPSRTAEFNGGSGHLE